MSLVDELGARVRTSADELPLDLVTIAVDRLRAATELLVRVRQAAADPAAVPHLTHATEHAEHAGHALRVAREHLGGYLTAIGLGAATGPVTERGRRPPPPVTDARPDVMPQTAAPRLTHWWSLRVAELTGEDPAVPDGDAGPAGSAELLRLVAAGVRAGDRGRLRRDLGAAGAPVGLGLAALTPPALHRLAGNLLGHEPRAADLPRLARATDGRVRDLLPGLPSPVLDTLLARVCRVPATRHAARPSHPADAAVTGAVLTGVLLELLGRDPDTLDAAALRADVDAQDGTAPRGYVDARDGTAPRADVHARDGTARDG